MCNQSDWAITWTAIAAVANILLAIIAFCQMRFICIRNRPILKLRQLTPEKYLLMNVGTDQANEIKVQFGNTSKDLPTALPGGGELLVTVKAATQLNEKLSLPEDAELELMVTFTDMCGKKGKTMITVEDADTYDQKQVSVNTPQIIF